jgi:hypothetical protein
VIDLAGFGIGRKATATSSGLGIRQLESEVANSSVPSHIYRLLAFVNQPFSIAKQGDLQEYL